MDTTKKILESVKKKDSLSGIADEVINSELNKIIKKDKIDLSNLKEKDIKIIVQDLRARLRKISGSFIKGIGEHSSTSEREEFYPTLKKKIDSLKPKSILDLGCGVNPLFLAKKGIIYYTYDINSSSTNKVKEFFNNQNIEGVVKVTDIRKETNFPETDLTILFKVLDLLDEKGHKEAEILIKKIKSKYILISFPTKTLSGAPMRHPQRGWIEHLLKRLKFSFEFFSSKNEIFYLATKYD